MWSERSHAGSVVSSASAGFTILEMLVAVVIIGVGVAGVMSAFSQSSKGSADPTVAVQLQAVAEQLMEEVRLKPINDPDGVADAAPSNACARDTFDNVADYNGYSTSGQVCNVDGTSIDGLSGYSVSIAVVAGTLSVAGTTSAPGQQITVAVKRGSDTFSLLSWRVDYVN